MPMHRLTSSSFSSTPAAVVIAGIALCAAAAAPPGPAGARAASTWEPAAAAAKITCTGTQTVTYSPGLSQRLREVTVHGVTTLSRCVSPADPRITAGRSTFRATGRLSCDAGGYSGTRKIVWTNGRTSTMSFTSMFSPNDGQGVVTVKGEVTDGEFTGQRWTATFTMFTTRPGACATREGLPTAAGRVVLGIGSHAPAPALPERSRPSEH
jgi:hypothetical protein